MTGSNNMECYSCDDDYAVSYDRKSCVKFESDKNCRVLAYGNTKCSTCYDAYIWHGSECKLGAYLIKTGYIVLFLILSYMV